MEMIDVIKDAQKRRARLLAEKERTGWTVAKLALKHKMSRARMSQLLLKAAEDEKVKTRKIFYTGAS